MYTVGSTSTRKIRYGFPVERHCMKANTRHQTTTSLWRAEDAVGNRASVNMPTLNWSILILTAEDESEVVTFYIVPQEYWIYGHLSIVNFCWQPRRGKPSKTLYTLQNIYQMPSVRHQTCQITLWAAARTSRYLHNKGPRWACHPGMIPREAQLQFPCLASLPPNCEGLIHLQQEYTGICWNLTPSPGALCDWSVCCAGTRSTRVLQLFCSETCTFLQVEMVLYCQIVS